MEEIALFCQWLQSYPNWNGQELSVDFSEGLPGSTGLFYTGTKDVSRQIDVQGNALVCRRHSFELERTVCAPSGDAASASWLADLQAWISRQNTAGSAPALGCFPERNRVGAEQGGLTKVTGDGCGHYRLKLWVEFYTYEEGCVDDGGNI